MPMKNPPHPGRMIREDLMEGYTTGQVAIALGVSRQTVDKIINERGSITPEMAIRLARVFGSTPDMWVRLQAAYDLAQVMKREKEIVATTKRINAA